jgi:uncharacterized Zn-binding protein involved in type VI secretion
MPPAARVTDMHTCPMVTGVVPHVGGPILPPGAPTVLIDFLPAATVTSMATCVGPPDVIVMGSTGVLINFLPAARLGDPTAHGGVIVMGSPTCIIGEVGAPSPGTAGAAGVVAGLAASGVSKLIEASTSVYGIANEPGSGGASKEPAAVKSGKGGSTTITVDDANKRISIKTTMEFCGHDATEEYAKAAKKQIEDTWSGKMRRNGADYVVAVTITTHVSKECTGRKDADQIIVDSKTNRMSQTLYGAGPGYQTPAAATDTDRPRRIAHEYGHTLGLDDDYADTPHGSAPKDPNRKNDIMSETWPDKNGVLPHPDQQHYDDVLKKYGL